LLVSLLAGASVVMANHHDVMSMVTEQGVLIGAGPLVKLPLPTLCGALGAKQRQARLDSLAGGAGWKRFSRKSIVAPVAIDVKYVKDSDGNRIGHLIHVGFVVHADLEKLKDKDMLQQMFGEAHENGETEGIGGEEVAPDKLDGMGIKIDESTTYIAAEITLLEAVRVRGVLHLEQNINDDSIVVSWLLDPRFNHDRETNNAWAPLENLQLADTTADGWQPYEGCGGYLTAHRLDEVPGASLIEVRMLLHEPKQWFNGSNRLRSKLPLLLQESARNFRRKLR